MERIDLHEVRHKLKLVENTGTRELYENREGATCPVCAEPFDEVLASEERTHRFDPPRRIGFCVVREDDRLLVFTHE